MTKKRVINKGIVPQYYVEDDHEPIIPKELFCWFTALRRLRTGIQKSDMGEEWQKEDCVAVQQSADKRNQELQEV